MKTLSSDEVAELLLRYKTKEVLRFIVDALGSTKNRDISLKVIEHLSKFKNKKLLESFLTSLGYNLPNDFLLRDLEELISQTEEEDVKETALYSLCRLSASSPVWPATSCRRKLVNCITAMRAGQRYLSDILSECRLMGTQAHRELAMKTLG